MLAASSVFSSRFSAVEALKKYSSDLFYGASNRKPNKTPLHIVSCDGQTGMVQVLGY